MGATAGIRMKRPAHPGGFVKHEIIEPLELSVTAAAQALGVTRATLSTPLNERASLSPEMALRIEKAFGVSMDTLMRMQQLRHRPDPRASGRDQGRAVRQSDSCETGGARVAIRSRLRTGSAASRGR